MDFRSLSDRFRSLLPGAWAAVFAALLLGTSTQAFAETRAIILASDYTGAARPEFRLANAAVDARAIDKSLRKAGLKNVRLVIEPSAADWTREIGALKASAAPGDTVLLYYAGHGLQVEGQNYFVAADGTTLIAVDEVLRAFAANTIPIIMIIDACRDNPLKEDPSLPFVFDTSLGGKSRALATQGTPRIKIDKPGLTQVGDLRGLSALVFFSTEPGNVALDGEPGAGSPFAKIMAREIERRDALGKILRRVSVAVNKETGGQQSPWRQGDLPFEVFLAGMPNFPVP